MQSWWTRVSESDGHYHFLVLLSALRATSVSTRRSRLTFILLSVITWSSLFWVVLRLQSGLLMMELKSCKCFSCWEAQGWTEGTHVHSVSRLSLSWYSLWQNISPYQHSYIQAQLVESDARVETANRINAIWWGIQALAGVFSKLSGLQNTLPRTPSSSSQNPLLMRLPKLALDYLQMLTLQILSHLGSQGNGGWWRN